MAKAAKRGATKAGPPRPAAGTHAVAEPGRIVRENVEFVSEGVTIRGQVVKQAGTRRLPAIIVTHGFGFVQAIFADHDYPKVFAESGYLVLVYDHPNTGRSDGMPRQELDPLRQQRAYFDAITYLMLRDDVDKARLAVWGTSYSGGHVLAVAAHDRRVKCVVSQVMTISGRANLERRLASEAFADLRQAWEDDRLARMRGEKPGLVSQVRRDESGTPIGSASAFIDSLSSELLTDFDPEVTLRSYEYYASYEPGMVIDRISPTPLLMIVCRHDTVTFPDLALEAYERARQPKKLVLLDGEHMDAYRRHFDTTAEEAVQWFDTHLR